MTTGRKWSIGTIMVILICLAACLAWPRTYECGHTYSPLLSFFAAGHHRCGRMRAFSQLEALFYTHRGYVKRLGKPAQDIETLYNFLFGEEDINYYAGANRYKYAVEITPSGWRLTAVPKDRNARETDYSFFVDQSGRLFRRLPNGKTVKFHKFR